MVLRNSTNYNGTFTISNVTTNTFEITATWVSDDAIGDWSVILENTIQTNTIDSTTRSANTTVPAVVPFSTNDTIFITIENQSDGTELIAVNVSTVTK